MSTSGNGLWGRLRARLGKTQGTQPGEREAQAAMQPEAAHARVTANAPELTGDALHAVVGAAIAAVWDRDTGFAVRAIRRV